MEIDDLPIGDQVYLPVIDIDGSTPVFNKRYGNLSLQERLRGWVVEKRARKCGKEEMVNILHHSKYNM